MCTAAGTAVKRLAGEYAGQGVVFIEYYQGGPGRETRFQAAYGDHGYSVPVAMVGSGYRYSQGPADFYKVFKAMIQADQARPAQSDIEAWWRKADATTLRIYATVHNTSGVTLDNAGNEAGVWGLSWESTATLGSTGMYSRAAVRVPITPAVPPGASIPVIVNLPISLFADWNNLHVVVATELRPAGTSGPYDMLQAVGPQPANFSVEPAQIQLASPQGPGLAELRLTGPHVLSWSALTSAPWLAVSPAVGTMGTPVRVETRAELLQPGQQLGTVTLTATSADGMSFVATVTVTATFDPNWTRPPRLPRRRLSRATPTETP